MLYFDRGGVACPDFSIDKVNGAAFWIEQGYNVYCRTSLHGKGGEDIVIASTVDELVDAPLYTKGVNADKEYRVHVFKGKVIDYVKKGRARTEDDSNRP